MKVLFLLLATLLLPPLPAATSQQEVGALEDLFLSTGGDSWLWRPLAFGNKWNFSEVSPNPCEDSWQGVGCLNNHVQSLALHRFNLSGTIPTSISNLTALDSLVLTANRITGTIPSLTGLTRLTNLDLNNNHLTYTIPEDIGELTKLKSLMLYYNSLSGTIPSTIGNLGMLTMLEFDSNQLTGGIPSSIGSATALKMVYLYSNLLSLPLPPEIGNLREMTDLVIYLNEINGSIPSALCQCSKLELLLLNENRLTGPLPEDLGNLSAVDLLYLYENHLSGTVPDSLQAMSEATVFGFSNNNLWGTLPSEIGNLQKMEILDVSFNALDGPIPNLSNFSHLQYFMIHVNQFSGPFPAEIVQLTNLTIIDIMFNHLTGHIPSSFGIELEKLQFLILSNNFLVGEIPESLLGMPDTVQIEMNGNYFSGRLATRDADEVQESSLFTLDMSDNFLSGPIPSTFTMFREMQYVLLSKNELSGDLDSVYNATVQRFLRVVDLSDNLFTGSIPELYFLGRLEVFSAINNCIRGDLPGSLCNASTLVTLAADGVGAASKCNDNRDRASLFSTDPAIPNGMPSCVINLPALQTLHLSGNGITGGVPALKTSTALNDLALAHNSLSGTLPLSYQAYSWSRLDLSYNDIDGSLDSSQFDFPQNSSLFLLGNLLSGEVPTTLKDTEDISILEGNIFSCDLRRDSLPEHDEYLSSYSCGSMLANGALVTWATVVCIVAALLLYFRHLSVKDSTAANGVVAYISYWSICRRSFMDKAPCSHFQMLLHHLERICGVVAVFLSLVLLPCFAVITHFYHTYTNQYAWTPSIVLTRGITPAFAIVIIWWVVVGAYAFYLHHYQSKSNNDESCSVLVLNGVAAPLSAKKASGDRDPSLSSTRKYTNQQGKVISFVVYSLALLVNVTVVGGLNVAYVYFFFNYESLSYTTLRVAQILFAVFKVLWSSAVVPNMMGRLRSWLHLVVHGGLSSALATSNSVRGVKFQVFIVLLNNIALPCAAAAIFSSHCFYDAVVDAPTVDVEYSYTMCAEYELNVGQLRCLGTYQKPQSSSYQPQFTYRYQCSSALVMDYVPIFLFMFVIVAFAVPILQLVDCKSASCQALSAQHDNSEARNASSSLVNRFYRLFASRTAKNLYAIREHHIRCGSDHSDAPVRGLFDSDSFCVGALLHTAVILTFGVCYPLLGICGCIAVFIQVQMTRLDIGRVIVEMKDLRLQSFISTELSQSYLDALRVECHLVKEFGRSAQWMIATYALLFHMLFAFDTLGYTASNSISALILAILIVAAPLCAAWSIKLRNNERKC